MSLRVALTVAILLFLGTLMVRLPARVLARVLPAGVTCEQPQGTVWHGACARVQGEQFSLSEVGWTLHPAGLLQLRLSAELTSADPRALGQAQVQIDRDGAINVQALQVHLPLQGGLAVFPVGLEGTLEVDVATLRVEHGALAALVGSLRAHSLRSDSFGELGDLELRFAPQDAAGNDPGAGAGIADRPVALGQLRDLSGPLDLQGQLLLTRGNAYQISGTLMARASASPALLDALQLLGAADSAGRRSFVLNGTL